MLSALLVTASTQGRVGGKERASRMYMWRVRPKWWLLALSPLLMGYLVVLVLHGLKAIEIDLASLGSVNYLPPLGLSALFLWFFTFGLGEETGWRGFALPGLQESRSALAATAILAAFWALWHLPQFFFLFDPSIAIGWLIGLFAGAVVLTWL